MTTPTDNLIDEFHRSLSATIAWCAAVDPALDIAHRFRSPRLRPPIEIAGNSDSLDLVHGAVEYVIERRFERIANTLTDAAAQLSAGRLLAYYPGFSLDDGFAAIESEGYFDGANVPPWDTWVFFIENFLISFVPPQVTLEVECGLITNVEECIIWLRDVKHPFVNELKARNLVD